MLPQRNRNLFLIKLVRNLLRTFLCCIDPRRSSYITRLGHCAKAFFLCHGDHFSLSLESFPVIISIICGCSRTWFSGNEQNKLHLKAHLKSLGPQDRVNARSEKSWFFNHRSEWNLTLAGRSWRISSWEMEACCVTGYEYVVTCRTSTRRAWRWSRSSPSVRCGLSHVSVLD